MTHDNVQAVVNLESSRRGRNPEAVAFRVQSLVGDCLNCFLYFVGHLEGSV